MNQVQILVLDFGSQYTQLIARRLREFGVYTEIVPYFETIQSIRAKNPKGIILSGGPASVYEEGAYMPDSEIFNLGIPVLGICYGMQYIAHHFGGKVVRAKEQEFGKAKLEIIESYLQNTPTKSTQNLVHTFMPSNDKEGVFNAWKKSFFAAHSFMGQSLLEHTATALHKRLIDSQILLASVAKISNDKISSAKNAQSFGFFTLEGKRCYFECYVIDRAFTQKDIVQDFLPYLCTATQAQSFETQWDKHDKKGVQAFIELGFTQGKSHGDMLELHITRSIIESKGDSQAVITKDECEQSSILAQETTPLFAGVKQDSIVWMSHADKVEEIPQGFSELAKSGNTHYCAIADCNRQIYALQFHPEVVHSECGGEILKNFAVKICHASTDWNMKNFIAYEIEKIRKITGLS